MTPKFGGGAGVDPAPICLPREHHKAKRYVQDLDTALQQDGWSRAQRSYLQAKRLKWLYRAEGRDPHFEEFGTFPGFPGSPPPTITDLLIAQRRRRYKTSGMDQAQQAKAGKRIPAHQHMAHRGILERYRRERTARAREARDRDDD